MRVGFELLKARPLTDSVDIDSLEHKHGVILPPKYRLFIETFYLGEKGITREQFYDKKSGEYFDCSAYIYSPNEDVGFTHFNEIGKSFEIWGSGGLSDTDYEKKYFPIGSGNFGGLAVGTEDDKDKIIFDTGEGNIILANDIFEFVRGIEIVPVEEEFLYGTKHSDLYKRWGENFWRVK